MGATVIAVKKLRSLDSISCIGKFICLALLGYEIVLGLRQGDLFRMVNGLPVHKEQLLEEKKQS